MLQIVVPAGEFFDERTERFIQSNGVILQLEHSLLSVSKWESKWKKPWLSKEDNKTPEENLDYIRCMTINKNVDPLAYYCISPEDMERITQYIYDDMTATTFYSYKKTIEEANDVITSEIIYYWMVAANIPFEAEKWHLNRLITLIRVCSHNNNPNKEKLTKADIYARNKAWNAARRKATGSKG